MSSLGEYCIDKAMRLIARYLAAGKLQTSANGMENLPIRGPALIVVRHYHHLFDGLALFSAMQRQFHIVVSVDWVANRRTKIFMHAINHMARWPMILRTDALKHHENSQRRLFSTSDGARYQREALRESVQLLVEGKILVVFPEGYPNIDPTYTPKTEPDQFLPFKTGFVRILRAAEARLGSKIPIIPAGIHYATGESWQGYLKFGTAIYRNENASRAELIGRLEYEVKRLSGISVETPSTVLPVKL